MGSSALKNPCLVYGTFHSDRSATCADMLVLHGWGALAVRLSVISARQLVPGRTNTSMP